MPENLFHTLLKQVQTNLRAHPDIEDDEVAISRLKKIRLSERPFFAVYLGADEPVGDYGPQNVNVLDHNVQVMVDIIVDVDAQNDLEQAFLDARTSVHDALMSDHTQGLAFVMQTIPNGAGEPVISIESEVKTASYRTEWVFQIRTSINDLTTVS